MKNSDTNLSRINLFYVTFGEHYSKVLFLILFNMIFDKSYASTITFTKSGGGRLSELRMSGYELKNVYDGDNDGK